MVFAIIQGIADWQRRIGDVARLFARRTWWEFFSQCWLEAGLGKLPTLQIAMLILSVTCALSRGDEIYEEEPYDVIVLSEKFKKEKFSVFPIPKADIANKDKPLRIRFIESPEKYYEIDHSDIFKIQRFPEIVLEKANKLIADKEFDGAYWHLDFLRNEYPDVDGLSKAISSLLYQDAGDAYRRGAYGAALSLLDEVRIQGGGGRSLVAAADNVAKKMFEQHIKKKDFGAARLMIEWAESRFGRKAFGKTLAIWESQLASIAKRDMAAAEKFIQSGDLRAAYDTSQRALKTWPKLAGVAELAARIYKQYPVVRVGVTRPALNMDPHSSEDWAARRTGRLRHRTLVELQSYGPDGGEYFCPIGNVEVSPDSREINVELQHGRSGSLADSFSGYDVANLLLDMARPDGPNRVPIFSKLAGGIAVRDVFFVDVRLRQPVLRPEALLQTPLASLDDDAPATATNPYVIAGRQNDELRLTLNEGYAARRSNQPVEIVEKYYDDPATMVEALVAQEIDVADRLFPGDIVALQRNDKITVSPYAVPSVHFLVPNYNRPLMQIREFRRALVYGISRETILRQDLLGNTNIPGSQIISGPLPPGADLDDPLGYAYDVRIKPRGYEPTLAMLLAQVARSRLETLAEKKGEAPPDEEPLILLHSADAVPRIAASAVAQYLTAIGLPCETKEMRLGQTQPNHDDWDLLYVDMVFTEPMFDIRRLLGSRGVIKGGSPYLELALRRLAVASTWEESRSMLQEIHRLAHEEVAVVPLWQLVEYFAFHPRVQNVAEYPLSLYQSVESWQIRQESP